MNDHRARPGNLHLNSATNHGSHYEYETTIPLREVIHDQFFMPVRNNLFRADRITFSRMDQITNRRTGVMLEYAEVRVIAVENERVPLFVVVAPVDVGTQLPIEDKKPPKTVQETIGAAAKGVVHASSPARKKGILKDKARFVNPVTGLSVERGFAGKYLLRDGDRLLGEYPNKEAAMEASKVKPEPNITDPTAEGQAARDDLAKKMTAGMTELGAG